MCGSRILVRQVEAGTGTGNQNDLPLHFGLGDRADPVTVTIRWPGGAEQAAGPLEVDRFHTVKQKG